MEAELEFLEEYWHFFSYLRAVWPAQGHRILLAAALTEFDFSVLALVLTSCFKFPMPCLILECQHWAEMLYSSTVTESRVRNAALSALRRMFILPFSLFFGNVAIRPTSLATWKGIVSESAYSFEDDTAKIYYIARASAAKIFGLPVSIQCGLELEHYWRSAESQQCFTGFQRLLLIHLLRREFWMLNPEHHWPQTFWHMLQSSRSHVDVLESCRWEIRKEDQRFLSMIERHSLHCMQDTTPWIGKIQKITLLHLFVVAMKIITALRSNLLALVMSPLAGIILSSSSWPHNKVPPSSNGTFSGCWGSNHLILPIQNYDGNEGHPAVTYLLRFSRYFQPLSKRQEGCACITVYNWHCHKLSPF